MKVNLIKKLGIGALTLVLAGSLNAKINAQDSTEIQKPKTLSINGWIEGTKGINQGNNIRLWPQLNFMKFKTISLIDVNNFYSFSKNDLYHEKIKLNLGKNLTLKPQITLHTNSIGEKLTLDANLSYQKGNYFGFFEVCANQNNLENPQFYTYHNLGTKLGSLGFFATGDITDVKNTYAEITFTGKDIKKSGISPFARMNIVNKSKPTYQVGVSVNPYKK